MCKFIGKSNERSFCKLSKSEILRLHSIAHVAMETTKTLNFTCQSKSFISILFTCHDLACELQPFSCHDLINDIHSQTARQNCVQPPETMSRSYSRLIIYLRDVLLHTFISIRRHFGNQKGDRSRKTYRNCFWDRYWGSHAIGCHATLPLGERCVTSKKTAARETITGKVSARLVRSAAIGHFFPATSK